MYNSVYGNFRNRKFSDIFENESAFIEGYKSSGVYAENNKISDDATKILFYLLYSEYGNSVVANSDENQFKYQIYSTIYEYGPTWEKRIELQSKIRNLTDEELEAGTKLIYNKALHPGNSPSTASLEELQHINEQTVSNTKRGKLNKYTDAYQILSTDVTREFVTKFKKYFIQIVLPELPLWYESEEENN